MEYFKDKDGQIYADMAYRLGKILNQYNKLSIPEEKYEQTLCFVILQNLLTQSSEYIRSMTAGDRKSSIFYKEIGNNPIWGLTEKSIIQYTFNEKLTLQNVIDKLRNSVSHPTSLNKGNIGGTGYTTIDNKSGIIEKFSFVNSPDVNHDGDIKQFSSEEKINEYMERFRHQMPNDLIINNQNGKFIMVRNGVPFYRRSEIEMDVITLRIFTEELANYLAQPININWDGITIKRLIAA
jgi:hypothetical protein